MKKELKKKVAKKGDANKEKMGKVIAHIIMETDGNICSFEAKGRRCDVLGLLGSVIVSNEGMNELMSEVMPMVIEKKLEGLMGTMEKMAHAHEKAKKSSKKKVVSKKKK